MPFSRSRRTVPQLFEAGPNNGKSQSLLDSPGPWCISPAPAMKRTFQPHNLRRLRTHGFRARMASAGGQQRAVEPPPQGPSSSDGVRLQEVSEHAERRFRLTANRKRSDFQRIQRDGRPFRTPHYAPGECPGRRGPVHRDSGSSPRRSRTRRRGTAASACAVSFSGAGTIRARGFDLVVILRAGADTVALDVARGEWEKARSAIRRHCEEARKRAERRRRGPPPLKAEREASCCVPSQRRPRGGSTS